MVFSVEENYQLKIALGLFNVSLFAAHLSVALSMSSISESPMSHSHLVNYSSQPFYLLIYRACEFKRYMVPSNHRNPTVAPGSK